MIVKTKQHSHHHASAVGDPDEVAICPVMHITVNKKEAESKGLVRAYKDKTYYLCCNTCTTQFDANPEQYSGT